MLYLPEASNDDPACCYEQEREDGYPDAETDDETLVRIWVGMLGYRSLDHSGWWRRVDGDSGLDGGGEWVLSWCGCGSCCRSWRRRRRALLAFCEAEALVVGCSVGVVEGERDEDEESVHHGGDVGGYGLTGLVRITHGWSATRGSRTPSLPAFLNIFLYFMHSPFSIQTPSDRERRPHRAQRRGRGVESDPGSQPVTDP